jgi:hypothetical protein
MKNESSSTIQKQALRKSDVVRSSYGFKIGEHVIEIKSVSEPKAIAILCKHYWDLIDKYGNIELLGEAEVK